jgi:hypothetical protein
MLRAGLLGRDYREVAGQILRIFLSLVFSRIWVPAGNSGRSRVPALQRIRSVRRSRREACRWLASAEGGGVRQGAASQRAGQRLTAGAVRAHPAAE